MTWTWWKTREEQWPHGLSFLFALSFFLKLLINLLTYKAVHGHVPNYIKELIKFKKPGKYNLRSNSDNLLLEIEKVKTYTNLGDRAF